MLLNKHFDIVIIIGYFVESKYRASTSSCTWQQLHKARKLALTKHKTQEKQNWENEL